MSFALPVIRQPRVRRHPCVLNCFEASRSSPKRVHTDAEGVFSSDKLAAFIKRRNTRVAICAGEAHWQQGIIERHIGTLRGMLDKMFLDHELSDLGIQEVVDLATEAKNNLGTYFSQTRLSLTWHRDQRLRSTYRGVLQRRHTSMGRTLGTCCVWPHWRDQGG